MNLELLVLSLIFLSKKTLLADPSYQLINSYIEKAANSNLWSLNEDFRPKIRELHKIPASVLSEWPISTSYISTTHSTVIFRGLTDFADSTTPSTGLTKTFFTTTEPSFPSASLSEVNTASCPVDKDNYNNLNWPETPAGEEAFPEEFCFTEDAYRLTRLCQRNSTWANSTQKCETQEQSNLTSQLSKYLNNSIKFTINDLLNIVKQTTKLNALDVYISSQLLVHPYCDSEVVFGYMLEIIDNILKVNASIMNEAQWKMRAADLWLNATTIATNCSNFCKSFEAKNFYFVKAGPNGNVAGIQVLQLPDGESTERIDRDKSLDSVIKQKYLKSALWLNPSCLNDTSLYFVAFYNDKYFPEDKPSVETHVFKVFHNGISTNCPFYLIYRMDNITNDSVDCRYWNRKNLIGTWNDSYLTRIESYPNHIVCTTNQIGEFSFVVSNEDTSTTTTSSTTSFTDSTTSSSSSSESSTSTTSTTTETSPTPTSSTTSSTDSTTSSSSSESSTTSTTIKTSPTTTTSTTSSTDSTTSSTSTTSTTTETSTPITDDLIDLLESNKTASEILPELDEITQNYGDFKHSNDIHLVGQIFEKISYDSGKNLNLTHLNKIISNMQEINTVVLSDSQVSNRSTDMILYYTDKIIQDNLDDYPPLISKNFITLIHDSGDFYGVIFFENDYVKFLNVCTQQEDLEKYSNLSSAVLLDCALKDQLNQTSKVIINIFKKNVLFVEKTRRYESVSKIVDVILPGISSDFKGPISIFHKMPVSSSSHACSFWNYSLSTNTLGSWNKDNDGNLHSSLVRCDFNHTTSFAYLYNLYGIDSAVLDVITYVSCAFSLFGLLVIIVTAILFKQWRRKGGNKIILNFAFSLILQIILFLVSGSGLKDNFCVAVGVLLHYAVLAEFCWMLVIALLQLKRFVTVLGTQPQHLLLKSCLFSWGVPLIPVICVLIFDRVSDAHNSYGENGTNIQFCYPISWSFYGGLFTPISLILFANVLIFIYIMTTVTDKRNTVIVRKSEAILHWQLLIFLFFILGITWIFGFISNLLRIDFYNNISVYQNLTGIIFAYLFSILAPLQGFVIFIFFVVLNKNVRDSYLQMKMFRCMRKHATYTKS